MPKSQDPSRPSLAEQGGLQSQIVATSRVPVSDLVLDPHNPRRGAIDALKESLEANGQYRQIVANRGDMQVVAGNHTLMAARELGWREIEVSFIDVPPEVARRISLVDNRSADLATYDDEELVEILGSLEDLYGTGYTTDDLHELLDELGPPPLEEDTVPSPPEEPETRVGEVIDMGDHRLVCGDATEPGPYQVLLEGEQAHVACPDAPYGVDYEGKTRDRRRIENDTVRGLEGLLESAFKQLDRVLRPGAPVYVFHPSGARSALFIAAFMAQGWDLRQTLVWLKQSLVLGHGDYHYQHEPILYGFKPGPGRLGRGGERWFGGNRQSSVLDVDRPAASREHPTSKPSELIERLLRNSTRRGELVLDPFGGSGSTLIACERLRRRARLIEIDPAFCDVIVGRWERLTGRRAERRG